MKIFLPDYFYLIFFISFNFHKKTLIYSQSCILYPVEPIFLGGGKVNMRRKIIGIFVCTLMIIPCSIPVLGESITLLNEDNHVQKNSHDFYQNIDDTVRSVAEFESVDELIITWPTGWSEMQAYFIDIIHAAEDAVHIRINIDNEMQKTWLISDLTTAGVSLDNITITCIPTDTFWCRDYGPFFVEKNDELAIVDFSYVGWLMRPIDNLYPTLYGRMNNIDSRFYTNFLLCLQGGNYMTDGNGRAMIADGPLHRRFLNRFLTNEEIIDVLKSNLGLNEVRIFKSQQDDGTGHIDMYSKLLDENTVLVGAWDSTDVNYQILEDNAINFSKLGLHVIRIPMLRNSSSEYPIVWSYTNSLIINGTHKKVVLVPQYHVSEDAVALSIYQQAMPDYEIRGIDCRIIIPLGGAIHCTTMTRPVIE